MKTYFNCLDLDVNMSFGRVAGKLTVLHFPPRGGGCMAKKATFKGILFSSVTCVFGSKKKIQLYLLSVRYTECRIFCAASVTRIESHGS